MPGEEIMYIIDRMEHGNGGVFGHRVLAQMPLEEALKKTPADFGVYRKCWGYWPIICTDKEGKNRKYIWNEDDGVWNKEKQEKKVKIKYNWTIRIYDGFCGYEFKLSAANGDICIKDLYELIRKKLDADPCKGTLLK